MFWELLPFALYFVSWIMSLVIAVRSLSLIQNFSWDSNNLLVKVKVKSLTRVQLFVTLWTVAYQTTPSMGFSRQEYWSGLPFPSPGDLPDPGIEPRSTHIVGRRFTV